MKAPQQLDRNLCSVGRSFLDQTSDRQFLPKDPNALRGVAGAREREAAASWVPLHRALLGSILRAMREVQQ
jgi:hypothetical protein